MKVKWTEQISASYFENIQSMFPDEAMPSDFDKDYEGEIIGTNKSFWGTTYLVVFCDDGQIRECEASNATIIK